jgi:hypothetical protein
LALDFEVFIRDVLDFLSCVNKEIVQAGDAVFWRVGFGLDYELEASNFPVVDLAAVDYIAELLLGS